MIAETQRSKTTKLEPELIKKLRESYTRAPEDLHSAHDCYFWNKRQDPTFEVYQREVSNKDAPLTRRLCGQAQETIDHIISVCPELGFTEHLSRHNSVAKVIVRAISAGDGGMKDQTRQ